MSPALIVLGPDNAGALARIHALGFDAPWSAADFRDLLKKPGIIALGVEGKDALAAFILVQNSGESAEILTLASDPAFRRQGFAKKLVRSVLTRLGERGTARLNLDVAADNPAGLALYESLGFTRDSTRKDYYQRDVGARVAALLMSRAVAGQCGKPAA
jgi:ribosomal-protein-alanine N-acetyltransferase